MPPSEIEKDTGARCAVKASAAIALAAPDGRTRPAILATIEWRSRADWVNVSRGEVAESADASDLKSEAARRPGSSPGFPSSAADVETG